MEEQTVAAEALRQTPDRAVRDPRLPSDLTEPGAGDEPMEEGFEKSPVPEPIGGGEGL
jgi:hypothetical protein